jgi:hypothetical protein
MGSSSDGLGLRFGPGIADLLKKGQMIPERRADARHCTPLSAGCKTREKKN